MSVWRVGRVGCVQHGRKICYSPVFFPSSAAFQSFSAVEFGRRRTTDWFPASSPREAA